MAKRFVVDEDPSVGMLFDKDEDAYKFYNRYVRKIGFSVRKNKVYQRNGVVKNREFVCSWEGQYKKKATPKKKRDVRRSGCKAMLFIKLNDNGKYVVTIFEKEHNHPLVDPRDSFTLRSHRHIDDSQKRIIRNMRSSGVRTATILRYLSDVAGGARYLNFTESDCHNLVSRTRTKFLQEGDAQCLFEYLESKNKANKFFFSKFQTDESNRLCGLFIADAKSRVDYGNFGDVICFDTTFKTNNYQMSCAPVVGVNHHGQTVLFGIDLLDCETTDAFIWLFETFLEAMGGKHPRVIFTDQAMSIAKAIVHVFPTTIHRLCLWHIFLNAGTNLSRVFGRFKNFATEFRKCIYNPETIQEFEESWKNLLLNFGLTKNPWMQNLYKLKRKWALVYAKDHFCAGMTTTQRSESINSFLKKFCKGSLILREFVSQYDKALDSKRNKERLADSDNKKKLPNVATQWVVELEASKKYTKKIFENFQAECLKAYVYKLDGFTDEGHTRNYSVRRIGKPNARSRSVRYVPSTRLAKCSCKKFEFEGILCAHILKVFLELEVTSLPSEYYLERWSKDATSSTMYDSSGEVIQADLDPELSKRYSDLSHYAQILVAKAAKNQKKHDIAMAEILQTISKLDDIFDDVEDQNATSRPCRTITLLDPRSKKRPTESNARKIGVLEKISRQKRRKTSKNIGNEVGSHGSIQIRNFDLNEVPSEIQCSQENAKKMRGRPRGACRLEFINSKS